MELDTALVFPSSLFRIPSVFLYLFHLFSILNRKIMLKLGFEGVNGIYMTQNKFHDWFCEHTVKICGTLAVNFPKNAQLPTSQKGPYFICLFSTLDQKVKWFILRRNNSTREIAGPKWNIMWKVVSLHEEYSNLYNSKSGPSLRMLACLSKRDEYKQFKVDKKFFLWISYSHIGSGVWASVILSLGTTWRY